MSGHITLNRRAAAIKLRSARSARYYYQRGQGTRYERDVPVENLVRAFEGNPKMRLRIRLADSAHFVITIDNANERLGYEIGF